MSNIQFASPVTIFKLSRGKGALTNPLSYFYLECGPVVSIATYGSRCNTVWMALESIARGTLKPARCILWIDWTDSYADEKVISRLHSLRSRGLEIKEYSNKVLGPHRKYYPYVEDLIRGRILNPLVIADDDVVYPPYWLEELYRNYEIRPKVINCWRARQILLEGEKFWPYRDWPNCNTAEASYQNLATGTQGVIYPPEFLRILKDDIGMQHKEFLNCCAKNDDLWLNVQALRAGFKTRQIRNKAAFFPTIPGTEATGLFTKNVTRNDHYLPLTYLPSDLEKMRENV